MMSLPSWALTVMPPVMSETLTLRRARRIAERDDDAVAGALFALLLFGGDGVR